MLLLIQEKLRPFQPSSSISLSPLQQASLTVVANQSCTIGSPRKNEFLTTNNVKRMGPFPLPEQALPQRTVLPGICCFFCFFFLIQVYWHLLPSLILKGQKMKAYKRRTSKGDRDPLSNKIIKKWSPNYCTWRTVMDTTHRVSDLIDLGWAREFSFLTSSQVGLILLVWDLCLENQGQKALLKWRKEGMAQLQIATEPPISQNRNRNSETRLLPLELQHKLVPEGPSYKSLPRKRAGGVLLFRG